MNIHEKLIQEGIRVNSQQEQQKVLCPKCSHTRRKNRRIRYYWNFRLLR